MSADNFKIMGNSIKMWNRNIKAAKNASADNNLSVNRKNTTRMDTFEISNRDLAVQNSSQWDDLSTEIKNEKKNIVNELSQSHVDTNRFLEIKAQVRAGKYEINCEDIAESLMPYLDFDFKV